MVNNSNRGLLTDPKRSVWHPAKYVDDGLCQRHPIFRIFPDRKSSGAAVPSRGISGRCGTSYQQRQKEYMTLNCPRNQCSQIVRLDVDLL